MSTHKETIGSRARLLAAADRLFLLHGYDQSSLDEVLSIARVTKSNFYYHFKSKEALGQAIIDQWSQRLLREWAEPLRDGLSPLERLRAMTIRVADQMEASGCQEGCPFGRLAMELGPDSGLFRRCVAQFFEQVIDRIWSVIVEGQHKGQIRAEADARVLAQLFVAQLEGAILLAKTNRHSRPIRACFETFAELLRASR
jgi:TetR/AcrR family transcriptional regulator, transcriptional repressor for nem operon